MINFANLQPNQVSSERYTPQITHHAARRREDAHSIRDSRKDSANDHYVYMCMCVCMFGC